MSTDYRYTVRNVAQKEIYDSYMGILRISPNLDSNGKMVDDPTNFLNTIGCQDIQLSSSNGDPLPVHFVPYSFSTQNVYFNNDGNSIRETKDIINICTDTTITNYASGNTYVSNEFIARSTIQLLDSSETSKKKSKIAVAYGCSTTDDNEKADCEGILLYPIESPNDSSYFNNKNGLGLFDPNNPKPRTEQVEESLLKKSQQWYNTTINHDVYFVNDDVINPTKAGENIQSHRVKVNNQLINQYNDNNEEIPVLYTRDYVLGHYEGHSQRTDKDKRNALKSHHLPSDSQIYEAEETDNVTKLSWIRFDNLIWDCLDEVLSGKIRHVNGRYDNLGTGINEEGNSIYDKLFGEKEVENISQCTNLYSNESKSQFIDYTAPLIGNGVQEGMIMYHAMPFHRYWFHRCRQVVFNMNEFKKQYALEYNGTNPSSWEDMISDEYTSLSRYKDNGLITPCCKASVTPHHSLVKDFLLCNGQAVNLTNFPNISLNNNNLLNDKGSTPLIKGKQATPNKDGENFSQKTKTDWSNSSTYYALHESSSEGNHIKLPNLFNFQEKYPRFIRGLNWTANTEEIQNFSENSNVDNKLSNNNDKRIAYINDDDINNKRNVWNDYGKCIVKNLSSVDKPYYFSFDYLTPKNHHKHLLFAKRKSITDKSAKNYTLCQYGRCDDDVRYIYFWDDREYHFNNKEDVGGRYLPILHNNYEYKAENAFSDASKYSGVWEPVGWKKEWENWYNYNFNDGKFYKGFQPVPTVGLYLFNKSFSNVENINDDKSTWHYYDASGKKHDIKDANITVKKPSGTTQLDFKTMETYRLQKFKRRQLCIKLNESQGLFPISYYGGPNKFRVIHRHTWKRKSDHEVGTFEKRDVASYEFKGANFTYKDGNLYAVDDGTYHWRTLTSLPYWDCDKLAVGNISKINTTNMLQRDNIPPTASDYYDYHSVTDIWRKQSAQKSEELTYGSTKITVDTTVPYPSFLNLIPLIRL